MALAAQPNPQISADSLDVLIGDMPWWWQPTKFSTGALQALTQGGRLHYIRNEELRRELAGWDAEIETVHHDERQDYTTFHDDVMPFLREHVYFPQVSGKVTHKPGKTDTIAPLEVPLRPRPADHRSLLAHPAFPNFLVQKWWVHWDALDVYDNFEMRSNEVLSLLEEELRRW